MSFPTTPISTTNLDAGTDNPSLARADLKSLVDAFNALIASRGSADGFPTLNSSGQTVFGTSFYADPNSGNAKIHVSSDSYLLWDNSAKLLKYFDGTSTIIVNDYNSLYNKPSINGPAFKSYLASSQSIPTAGQTKINFTTEVYDTDGCYSSGRFTPNKAGYYNIYGKVRIDHTNAQERVAAFILFNGAWLDVSVLTQPTANNELHVSISSLIYFNGTTDYVELGAGVTWSTQTALAGTGQTTFYGYFVRS